MLVSLALAVAFLTNLSSVRATSVYCSAAIYGIPDLQSCISALANIRPNDYAKRLFVEQQLRTSPPEGNWKAMIDPRPAATQEDIAQIPKWWSFGTDINLTIPWKLMLTGSDCCTGNCNVAVLSYARWNSRNAVSSSRWSDVAYFGKQVASTCLISNNQGGAGVIRSKAAVNDKKTPENSHG